MTPIAYLRAQMAGLGNFIAEYRELSTEDKATLHKWAIEEMNTLGIEIKTAAV